MVWNCLLSASFLRTLVSSFIRGTECHCRQQNRVRVSSEVSAERWAVQSQQCCHYVMMGRIILILMSICAFTFKKVEFVKCQ